MWLAHWDFLHQIVLPRAPVFGGVLEFLSMMVPFLFDFPLTGNPKKESAPVNHNKNQPKLLNGTGNPKKETAPVNPKKNPP